MWRCRSTLSIRRDVLVVEPGKKLKLSPASWGSAIKNTAPNHQPVREVQTDIRGPSPGRSGHASNATVPLAAQPCLCRRWVASEAGAMAARGDEDKEGMTRQARL